MSPAYYKFIKNKKEFYCGRLFNGYSLYIAAWRAFAKLIYLSPHLVSGQKCPGALPAKQRSLRCGDANERTFHGDPSRNATLPNTVTSIIKRLRLNLQTPQVSMNFHAKFYCLLNISGKSLVAEYLILNDVTRPR